MTHPADKLGGRDHFGRKPPLWEMSRIQGDQEVGLAFFSTPAKAIISTVRRDLNDFPDFYFFSFLLEQVYQPPRNVRADLQSLSYLLIFLQNLGCHEPNEAPPLNPFVK